VSSKAEKYFAKLKQRNFSGWRSHELQTLFLGYGYKLIHGTKHDTFIHIEFRHVSELYRTLPRHAGELDPAYARKALAAIRLILELREKGDNENE
jgi:hypothetical protein